jgi:hypothetical protein
MPFQGLLRVLNVDFLQKQLQEWIENCEMNPLSLINPSLEIVYCSMTLSNHDIIRLVRFVSKIKVGVMEWVLSLIYV